MQTGISAVNLWRDYRNEKKSFYRKSFPTHRRHQIKKHNNAVPRPKKDEAMRALRTCQIRDKASPKKGPKTFIEKGGRGKKRPGRSGLIEREGY